MIIDPILKAQTRDRVDLINEIFQPTIKLLEKSIKQFDILNIFAKIRMMRLVDYEELRFSEHLKTFLLDKIITSINLTLTSYQTLLNNPLDQPTLERLYWSLLQDIVYTPFHNLTLEQRIDRSVRHTFKHIETLTHNALIEGSGPNLMMTGYNPHRLIRDIKSCFLSYGQVSGGSAVVWNTRILIGEQNRAYQLTAKAFMKEAGVTHIKWVPHPSKPLSALCEEYSTIHDGIWLIDEVPDYPYPGCCCSLEPLI